MEKNQQHSHDEANEIIRIPDGEGNEIVYEILFWIDHPETGKRYIFLLPEDESDSEEGEVHVYRMKEEEDEVLFEEVETEEEWDMLEEVFNTFLEEKILTDDQK